MDLRIAHDRVGSSDDPTLNGHLKYPNNLDQSLNDVTDDKIRKYRADYNNRPPSVVSFMPTIPSTSGRLHSEFVRLLFLQAHRETDRFFAASGVQLAQTNPSGQFHFRRAAFASMLKSRVGNILDKAEALRSNLNLDGVSIVSKSHTHPSHSQTSRLLTSSLSLGVPVSRQLKIKPIYECRCDGRLQSKRFTLALSIHNKQQLSYGSSSDRSLNGNLYYPNDNMTHDIDRSLNEVVDKSQQLDQPSSRVPFWHPSGWYTC
jgi:hypothetical protein